MKVVSTVIKSVVCFATQLLFRCFIAGSYYLPRHSVIGIMY